MVEVLKEVKRLLRCDLDAEDVKYDVLTEEQLKASQSTQLPALALALAQPCTLGTPSCTCLLYSLSTSHSGSALLLCL